MTLLWLEKTERLLRFMAIVIGCDHVGSAYYNPKSLVRCLMYKTIKALFSPLFLLTSNLPSLSFILFPLLSHLTQLLSKLG